MSKCNLSAGKTPYDLMRATFPAGTVIPHSGTKIRALQIIADLDGIPQGGTRAVWWLRRLLSFWWGERPREPFAGVLAGRSRLVSSLAPPKPAAGRTTPPSPGLRPPSPTPVGEGQWRWRRHFDPNLINLLPIRTFARRLLNADAIVALRTVRHRV